MTQTHANTLYGFEEGDDRAGQLAKDNTELGLEALLRLLEKM
jgi:hypothetical protein